MPARIRRLPSVVANQIAAGEVVERPAAVVKELLENSIDAGAAAVRIDVEDGGVKLIRVRDDGHGMTAEELPLALARHATSKVATSDDLHQIVSLGFRGEALPSIASVARVQLSSRVAERGEGYVVRMEGAAEAPAAEPMAHPCGTTVEVRDLFFNTPARRRFLRTARTEYLHIEQVATRVALASPSLALELWRDGKRTLNAQPAANDPLARLRALAGASFARHADVVDDAADDMYLSGWVLGGAHARAHADVQYLSVNGRAVRDPMLRHALRTAFADVLEEGRQPAYVLFLTVAPERVDVNVHPTKHELRFSEPAAVHDFLVSAVRRVVGSGVASLPLALEEQDLAFPLPGTGVAEAKPDDITTYRPHPLAGGSAARGRAGSGGAADVYAALAGRADLPRPGAWVRELAPGYILTRAADAHYVVDVAALARAAIQEAILAADCSRPTAEEPVQHAVEQAPLLIPFAFELTDRQMEHVTHNMEQLNRLGFDLRFSAPTQMLMTAVPRVVSSFAHADLAEAFTAISTGQNAASSLVQALSRLAGAEAARAPQAVVERWLRKLPESALDTVCVRLDPERLTRLFR